MLSKSLAVVVVNFVVVVSFVVVDSVVDLVVDVDFVEDLVVVLFRWIAIKDQTY